MAMSKDDYVVIGENTYHNGGDRPVGNSWQIKAQQQGFDCAQTDAFDARQEEVKAHAIELDALAGKSSPQEQATKATDSPSKADENQSEGVGSLTVENRATGPEDWEAAKRRIGAVQFPSNESLKHEFGLDVAKGVDFSVVSTVSRKLEILDSIERAESLWQTQSPEQIVTDIHSVIENLRKPEEEYQRSSDPLAHHIELLIEQAVKEPNVKRMQRLMNKINHLRYRQMKLISVAMSNGAGMYLFKH